MRAPRLKLGREAQAVVRDERRQKRSLKYRGLDPVLDNQSDNALTCDLTTSMLANPFESIACE